MGCGSSTKVETISREESKSYSRNTSAKRRQNGSAQVEQRRPIPKPRGSSASSRPSSTSSKRSNKYVEEMPKSSSISSSNESHDNTLAKRKTSGGSQRSTGSARKTETEQADVQVIRFNNERDDIDKNKDENENKEIETHVNMINTNDAKDSQMTRAEKHEEKAKLVEERRIKAIKEEEEDREIADMQLAGIDVEGKEEEVTGSDSYTIDDIVNHNTEVGTRDWFKFGRKVYSADLMIPFVKERIAGYVESRGSHHLVYCFGITPKHIQEIKEKIPQLQFGYPIYTARTHGVTRKELKKVLSVCLIGTIVDLDRDIKLERLKQSVENTLEALSEQERSENTTDYGDQLNRWLQEYPNVPICNEPPEMGIDPNSQSFPLPKSVLFDPLLLRKWVEDWTGFDHEVSGEVAWVPIEPMNESIGDTHEMFMKIVKESHVDENIAELDMTIDGEAAWHVIEVDMVRNDKTTEAQEKTLSTREKRKNMHDPAWQAKRRSEIANAFIARHEMDPNVMTPYLSFYENLEIAWKQFQELCESDFVPPKRSAPDTTHMHVNKSEKRKTSAGSRHSDTSPVHNVGVEPNVLPLDDYVQNNEIPNNEKDNNIPEEQINAFLTLADNDSDDKDGEESNQPLILAEDDDGSINEPVVFKPARDDDHSTVENGRIDDQVDNNRNAVGNEQSGIQSPASNSTIDITERSQEATDNDIGIRYQNNDNSAENSVHNNNDKSSEQGTDGVLFMNNETSAPKQTDIDVQNNDFNRLVLNEDPSSQTQEEAEQLINELEFENNSSNGNPKEF